MILVMNAPGSSEGSDVPPGVETESVSVSTELPVSTGVNTELLSEARVVGGVSSLAPSSPPPHPAIAREMHTSDTQVHGLKGRLIWLACSQSPSQSDR